MQVFVNAEYIVLLTNQMTLAQVVVRCCLIRQ